jgi:hypothetical protein
MNNDSRADIEYLASQYRHSMAHNSVGSWWHPVVSKQMASSQSRLVGRLSGQVHFPRLDDQRMEGYKENGSSPSHYELLVGLAR